MPGDQTTRNRSAWDRWSDGYQSKHGWLLADEHAEAWGLWRQPESSLGILGPVAGKRVLELGCGAAHWSRSLAGRGAEVVGLDVSRPQLRHAAAGAAEASGGGEADPTFVQAVAEALPFADETFDVVFSDYGGMSWADPADTVPEVGRVLRPGGLLAYCTTSPFFFVCIDSDAKELREHLVHDYFGMRTRAVAHEASDYQVPYGEWIRLLRVAGLVVEDLVEVQPPPDAVTTFGDRPLTFARRWPVENIWRARKAPAPPVEGGSGSDR